MKASLRRLLFLSLSVVAFSANAIQPIPEKPGWSGYVILGVGSITTKTNMVAGVDRYNIDIGDATIDSLSDDPDSNSAGMPQVDLSVNYTFSGQTQLFIGNSLENLVQFDRATIGGVRQQFSDKSILELSFVSSPRLSPVQVWEDPYVVGTKRKETDRTSNGLRIEYDRILGTGFGVQYTQRKVEIDDELSGTTQLGLPAAQADLLNREGDVKRLQLSYTMERIGRNQLKFDLDSIDEDLDGEAMAGDGYRIQVTHVYFGDRFTIVSNILGGKQNYDKTNPVFNKKREDDILGVGFVVFDNKIFNSKNWFGQATLVWFEEDSNIDFYYASSTFFALGAQYRF